jgi:hypothetical protein
MELFFKFSYMRAKGVKDFYLLGYNTVYSLKIQLLF